jgi:hypothetical protein
MGINPSMDSGFSGYYFLVGKQRGPLDELRTELQFMPLPLCVHLSTLWDPPAPHKSSPLEAEGSGPPTWTGGFTPAKG